MNYHFLNKKQRFQKDANQKQSYKLSWYLSYSKEHVKLIQWVKTAHSFLQSV